MQLKLENCLRLTVSKAIARTAINQRALIPMDICQSTASYIGQLKHNKGFSLIRPMTQKTSGTCDIENPRIFGHGHVS
ncbi:hypothetical protein ACTXT7_015794 [Hymenolepis weldensis]